MGSTGSDLPQNEELTVLVTGFGPFKQDFPINPSWAIAERLPEYLPPARSSKPASTTSSTSTATPSPPAAGIDLPPVRILVHPEPIRVNYQTVRSLVPGLWDLEHTGDSARPRIDLAVHIGMAGPRLFWSVERRGHRDGYAMRDVDGEFLRDQERRAREGSGWVWDGVPKELLTEYDLEDVLARWKGYSPNGLDLRVSEDAGRYLCDFIYFSSLAHLWKAGEKRRVVFLHVPADNSEANIAIGRDLVLQLIRSIVESEVVKRQRKDL